MSLVLEVALHAAVAVGGGVLVATVLVSLAWVVVKLRGPQ